MQELTRQLYDKHRKTYDLLALYDRLTAREWAELQEHKNYWLYLPVSIDWVYEEFLNEEAREKEGENGSTESR